VGSFDSSGIFSLFEKELISLRISGLIFLPYALNGSPGIRSLPGNVFHFSFSIAISDSRALCSGTSGSAVYTRFVCITLLFPCTFNSCEKCFLRPAKILWSLQPNYTFHSLLY
jgi:hypothetical protein